MALVNIYLRRQQMLSLIASDASVNRDQFYRLMFLTISEVGTCGLRAIFNLMSFQNGPQPMGHRGAPFHNLTKIESIEWSSTTTSGRLTLHLSFFTVVACSYVFFMCFATSESILYPPNECRLMRDRHRDQTLLLQYSPQNFPLHTRIPYLPYSQVGFRRHWHVALQRHWYLFLCYHRPYLSHDP